MDARLIILLISILNHNEALENVPKDLTKIPDLYRIPKEDSNHHLNHERQHKAVKLNLKGLVNIEHFNINLKDKHEDYTRAAPDCKSGRCGCGGGGVRCGDNTKLQDNAIDQAVQQELCKRTGRCGCGGGGRCGDNIEEEDLTRSRDFNEELCKKTGRCGCGGGGRCGNNIESAELDAALCKLTGLRCGPKRPEQNLREVKRTDSLGDKVLDLVPYKSAQNVKSVNYYGLDEPDNLEVDLENNDDRNKDSLRFFTEIYNNLKDKLRRYILKKLKEKLMKEEEASSKEIDYEKHLTFSTEQDSSIETYHTPKRSQPDLSFFLNPYNLRRVPPPHPSFIKQKHFPLTKKQKKKLFGMSTVNPMHDLNHPIGNNKLYPHGFFRRNMRGEKVPKYGVPFELQVEGLGQVNS